MCVCAGVITTATALLGCSFLTRKRSDTAWHHHMSMRSLSQANWQTCCLLSHIASVDFKGISIRWLACATQRAWMYCIHVWVVGGGTHQRWLMLICIYVLAVKLIQITIIISGCDMTLISGQLSFIHLLLYYPLNWAQIVKGLSAEWVHLVSRDLGQWGKSAFYNNVREKTHPAKMAAALYTVQLANRQQENEGWDWNPSKSKSDFLPDLLFHKDSM